MQHLKNDQQTQAFIGSGVLDSNDLKFIQEYKKRGLSDTEAVNKLIDEYKTKAYDENGITFDEHTTDLNDVNIAVTRKY